MLGSRWRELRKSRAREDTASYNCRSLRHRLGSARRDSILTSECAMLADDASMMAAVEQLVGGVGVLLVCINRLI